MAAINKRKVLESAQRHLQKGALDKALKDYQSVLEADPRDTNVRLKIGDLQLRRGNQDEAIAAYLKVADQFVRDGFDAKAVAIYKQVMKIDGKRHDVYVPLADLYQRLGLVSEAMGALQTAADAYHREGRKREALDLLRRMASLDPSNTTSRLKVAELLRQEGLEDEALAEYGEAAAELERQGDWEARVGVLERILELRPDRVDALEALASIWLDRNQAEKALPYAERLSEAGDGRPEAHELLARACDALGRRELAVAAWKRCADAWRTRGDESRAREIVQRYLPSESFAIDGESGRSGEGASGAAPEESPFGSEGDLGADPTTLDGRPIEEVETAGLEPTLDLGGGEAPPEIDLDMPEPEGDEAAPPAAAPGPPPRPEVGAAQVALAGDEDIEQLLAEATVYVRYGKHDRAIASLEAVLARAPDHIDALEQLGAAYEGTGASDRALEHFARAAELASEAGDAARFAALHARVEAIDPATAAMLDPPPGADAAPGTPPADAASDAGAAEADAGLEDEGLEEIEIDLDAAAPAEDAAIDLDAGAAAPAAPGARGPAALEETDPGDIEIDLDADAFEADAASDDAAEASAAEPEAAPDEVLAGAGELAAGAHGDDAASGEAPGAGAEADAAALDLELELDDEAPDAGAFGQSAAPAPPPDAWELPEEDGAAHEAAAAAPDELSLSASRQIEEDLEEAGFYLEQDLLDEAEAIYLRVLARAPNHPGALLRIGEIAVRRAGGAGAAASAGAAARASGDTTERAVAPEPVAALPEDADAALAAAAAAPSDGDSTPIGVDAGAAEIEPPSALDLAGPELADDADDATGGWAHPVDLGDDTLGAAAAAAAAEPDDEPELTTPDLAAEPAGPAFDLAAELSEALGDPNGDTGGAATDDDGFASLFREFKRGVSQTLGEGDVETHFDLGIAYREMGLLEDAIGEFRYALGAPTRRLDALHLMGLCALDLGRGQDAVGHLEQALASPDVPGEREAPLRFDLGRAYRAQGDVARALDAFRRVAELAPGFQDVEAQIAALERSDLPAEGAASEEIYESFDDLVADTADAGDEVPAPAGAAEPERFESFDDLVAEAEVEAPDETTGGAGVAAEPAATRTESRDAVGAAPSEPRDEAPQAYEPEPEPAPPPRRRRRRVSFF